MQRGLAGLIAVIANLVASQLHGGEANGAGSHWLHGSLQAFLDTHCIECHDEDQSEGGLNLDALRSDLANEDNLRRWILIHDRIDSGEMPPEKRERPEPGEQKAVVSILSDALFDADEARSETVLRRLNRVEYENTLSDLLGQVVHVKSMLPEDGSLHGFDTVGEALSISAEQMQVYLEAADAALDLVLGDLEKPEYQRVEVDMRKDLEKQIGKGKLFFDTGEGVAVFHSGYNPSQIRSFRAKTDGTYRVTIKARAFQSETPVVMRVYGGDIIANRREKHLAGYWDILPGSEWTTVTFEDFLRKNDGFYPKPYGTVSYVRAEDRFGGRGLELGPILIEGPLEEFPPPGRERLLLGLDPETATFEDIGKVVRTFLPRAYRRPVGRGEEVPFLKLADNALREGRSWTEALRLSLKGILCSPDFLFLDEPGRDRVSEYALASRLSYFLWSTCPDEELLRLAQQRQLSKQDVLHRQVERLLEDPKSERFVEQFTGQWLKLREIDATEPDSKLYPEFDEGLKLAMLDETRLFFTEILENDLPVRDFIDSDWTFLNRRLAWHYGIEGPVTQEMEKVTLPEESVRGGVLTQASVLKVTANGSNTSPVLRGVWFLENIVGKPTPPPPPSVPGIEPDIRGATTIRQQLDQHREIKSCAACHATIDPPGFALEQFDVIGGERSFYRSLGEGDRVEEYIPFEDNRRVRYLKGPDVDLEGTKFSDIAALKQWLITREDEVARCLTEKLLTYALGRGMGFSDRESVAGIVRAAADSNYGFRTLIQEVVVSDTFMEP